MDGSLRQIHHAELIVEQFGVGDLRAAVTPGVDGADKEDNEDDIEIVGADATRFRGVAARCNYLAFDRPDIQFATKEDSDAWRTLPEDME